eukprot:12886971-Prorocentrum_lima.AAC.1
MADSRAKAAADGDFATALPLEIAISLDGMPDEWGWIRQTEAEHRAAYPVIDDDGFGGFLYKGKPTWQKHPKEEQPG